MPNIRVSFSGLLGYTRIKGDKEKLAVVFPSLPVPDVLDSSDPARPITLPHYGFLSFEKRFLGESVRKPEIVFKEYGASAYQYGFFLGPECLTLKVGDSPSGVGFYKNDTVSDDQQKPDENLPVDDWIKQRQDYRWILGMERAAPGCGKIDQDCLSQNLNGVVASRVEILDGTLSVNLLVGEIELGSGKRSATLYEMKKTKIAPKVDRVLAEEVVVDIKITSDDGDVRFISQGIGGVAGAGDLVLNGYGADIECRFLCSELDQIIRPQGLVFDNRNARDLIALYDFAASRPTLSNRRFPISTVTGDNGGAAGDRICPGVLFNG